MAAISYLKRVVGETGPADRNLNRTILIKTQSKKNLLPKEIESGIPEKGAGFRNF